MENTTVLLVSYLIVASIYTFESVINKDKIKKYRYLAPFIILGYLFFSWFYFPYDIAPKLYKKLNEEEKEKR